MCKSEYSRVYSYNLPLDLTDAQWARVMQSLRRLPDLLPLLGPGPDPQYRHVTGGEHVHVELLSDGVRVSGKGLLRDAGGALRGASADALVIRRSVRRARVETCGLPYDAAVRLAIYLLECGLGRVIARYIGATEADFCETGFLMWQQGLRQADALPQHPLAADFAQRMAAEADPRISVEPLADEPLLWRASVCGTALAPLGGWATSLRGRRGFAGRVAALIAATEALRASHLAAA